MAQSYEKAGVNLEAGYEVVRRIKKHVASTSRLGVMGNIGAFGGMFDLSALNVKEPVLVSGTDDRSHRQRRGRGLPSGRLRAGGRRDGRDAGHVCAGRV